MGKQIVIGTIVAPHGVRGDIRILPEADRGELLLKQKVLLLPDGRQLHLEHGRVHKNLILAKVRESASMDEAEALRGLTVSVAREDLPALREGRYYVSDLVGLEVRDEAGNLIGTFKEVLPAGGADVYVITCVDGREELVAAIDENIKKIDLKAGQMIVRLPEWDEAK